MYFVSILSNWDDSVLYIGVTGNLPRRPCEHRNGLVDGFTKRYNVRKPVYYEYTNDVYSAISREKQLKDRSRKKKDFFDQAKKATAERAYRRWDGSLYLLSSISADFQCIDPSAPLGMTGV